MNALWVPQKNWRKSEQQEVRREERDVVLGAEVVCRYVCLLFCAVQRIPMRLLVQRFPDGTKMVMMMCGALGALSACAKRSIKFVIDVE